MSEACHYLFIVEGLNLSNMASLALRWISTFNLCLEEHAFAIRGKADIEHCHFRGLPPSLFGRKFMESSLNPTRMLPEIISSAFGLTVRSKWICADGSSLGAHHLVDKLDAIQRLGVPWS